MDINVISSIAVNFFKYRNNDSELIAALNSISKVQIQKQFESYKERESIEKVVKIRYKVLEHLTVSSIDENTLISIKESVAKEYPNTKILQNWRNFGLCYKLIYSEYEDGTYQYFKKLIVEIIEKLSLTDIVKYRIVDFNGPQNNGNDEAWFAIYNKNHDTQKTAQQLFFKIKGNEDIRFGLYKHTESVSNLLTIKPEDFKIDLLITEFKKHIEVIKNDIPLKDDKNYWLFQANPKIYDLQSFLLNNHATISFSVNQSKKQISKNDIVYFWISGRQGGIFAKGKIYDGPSVLPEFEYEKAYKRDKAQLDNYVLRVYINITNNFVNEPLVRDEIKHDSILAQLEVLRFANATNYRITPEQAARIDELLNIENQGENNMTKCESLNTILYGPPGTGKTYNVINKAVEIIDGGFSENRATVVKRYNELKEAGQIDFITFHQSFSYEEFIEGIKPKNDSNGSLIYDTEEGVLKSICTRAKIRSAAKESVYDFDETKTNFYKMSLGNTQDDGDVITDYCIENGIIGLGYGGDVDYTGAKTKESVTELYNKSIGDDNKFPVEAINRFRNWIQINDIVIISAGNYKVRAIGKVIGDYFYDENRDISFNHYRKVEWLYTDSVIPVNQILKDKIFSQQTIYQFYKKDLNLGYIRSIISSEEENIDIKPYVLIIDEINRGNISKIFGELITLIEDDKRLGAENEITVTLPYSKEKFGVPSNLYIIGTMNTADRSIALMDTALRRRFTFIEMMPDLTVLENVEVNGIDITQMLAKINERIEFLYDRDHTIGHAYFIKLKGIDESDRYSELCNIFSTRIIPLLQEYFYEDWEKIQLVLWDHIRQLTGSDKDSIDFDDEVNKKRFIQSRLFKEKDVLGFDHENYEDRITYRINPELNEHRIDVTAFIKIYS